MCHHADTSRIQAVHHCRADCKVNHDGITLNKAILAKFTSQKPKYHANCDSAMFRWQ